MARILLIGPSFFGYRDRIADEMRRLGHDVDTIDDRPSESVAFKSIAKISPALLRGAVARYSDVICKLVASRAYGYVIYVGGMTFLFNRKQVQRIREASRSAIFVAYLWDSLANSSRLVESFDQFDRTYSFDPLDCAEKGLEFRPLFFSGAYGDIPPEPEDGFDYDACFVGSVHQPSKFATVKSACDRLEKSGMRVFKYFFMPSKLASLLRSITDPVYRGVHFEYRPLKAAEVASIYARSLAVIDSPQAGQSGLTMRTLETLGAHRKLITANADIRNYDIFHDCNVFVLEDGSTPDKSFFTQKFNELPADVYESFSINSFVQTILGEKGSYQGYRRPLQ